MQLLSCTDLQLKFQCDGLVDDCMHSGSRVPSSVPSTVTWRLFYAQVTPRCTQSRTYDAGDIVLEVYNIKMLVHTTGASSTFPARDVCLYTFFFCRGYLARQELPAGTSRTSAVDVERTLTF